MTHPPTARRLAVAIALTLSLAGCSSSSDADNGERTGSAANTADPAAPSGADFEPDGGTWTVLHYSIADNDLEPFMSADVNELGDVGSTGGLQVREFMDRSPDYGDDDVLDQGSWVGARVFDIADDGSTQLVDDLGDVNSADPQTLADFVAQGITDLPADHYALVISDHGGQWTGIGVDESAGYIFDLAGLASGIRAGLDGAGVDTLDLLGFDACLMAGYEVATAMAPLADRMVASQESEPGHGWDYHAFSAAADGASPDGLGKSIVDGFAAQSEEQGDAAGVTLSLVDLTQVDALSAAVADFGSAVAGSASAAPVVGRAQTEVPEYGKSADPAQGQHLSDLGQLASTVGAESPEVADAADALAGTVDSMVLYEFAGDAQLGSTGLSIYLPPTSDTFNADYSALESAGSWRGFLDTYYGFGRSIPTEAVAGFTQDAPDIEYDADGVTLYAGYDPAGQDNLTQATISYAIYEDDGTVTYLGEESADLGTTDDPTAVGTFDFTTLEMTDGEDTVSAYTDLKVDEDAGLVTITVPLVYYAPDSDEEQDVVLALVLDAATGDYISDTYYSIDPDNGLVAEASLDPDGIIYPEVPNYDADGNETWLVTSDIGLYADIDTIDYDFTPLDPGTELQMDLGLYDFGGNVAYATTTDVVVP
ncbi:hypothetical protein BH11ACT8_BH11ACT8_22800 [soil metagenome]